MNEPPPANCQAACQATIPTSLPEFQLTNPKLNSTTFHFRKLALGFERGERCGYLVHIEGCDENSLQTTGEEAKNLFSGLKKLGFCVV